MTRIIEARLPLAWLIGTASFIVFSLGGIYVKIDTVARAVEKQEDRVEVQQRQINNHEIEIKKNDYGIGTLTANIAEVKAEFKSLVFKFETQVYK